MEKFVTEQLLCNKHSFRQFINAGITYILRQEMLVDI